MTHILQTQHVPKPSSPLCIDDSVSDAVHCNRILICDWICIGTPLYIHSSVVFPVHSNGRQSRLPAHCELLSIAVAAL